jgi:hypothetical protein
MIIMDTDMEKILKLAEMFEQSIQVLANTQITEEWLNVVRTTVKNIVDETYAHFKIPATPYKLDLKQGPDATVASDPTAPGVPGVKPSLNVMFALKEPNQNQMLKKEIFRWLSWKLNGLTNRQVTGDLPFVINKPQIQLS